ncbi:MAG: sigma-54-dependent Fis family transcriptional regulator [Desulfofustis sp.]|nr:sigma-54-dependent Fis family transcriptional regulator [Desulfofustis sp.]
MTGGQREFFRRIKQAIISNPFGQERTLVDRELAGVAGDQPADSEVLEQLLSKVSKLLNDIKKKRRNGKLDLDADDLQLFKYGVVFDLFHRYCPAFDSLISEQIDKGEVSCRVSFARDIVDELIDADFSESDSMRTLALFFQMRRAFFFISSISGESDCVQELRKSLWNNIFTENLELYESYLWNRMEDFSTMLLGETGTGKGLAASAIGRSGFIPFDEKKQCFKESFVKTFISINLSQFPEQLIESELFGHKKGAFTGAIDSHQGIFSRCSPCGAIFIDEIGEVPIPVQIKLLQVLQEREFTPVGSHLKEKFQGRVIGATNQPLTELRKKKRFREDFYYRLCSDVIEVPSLRQRVREHPAEITILLSFIIERIVGRQSPELVEKIGQLIVEQQPDHYRWPGNIRELEQCVRQILLNGVYNWQQIDDPEHSELAERIEQGTLSANQLLSTYCSRLYAQLGTYEAVAKVTQLDRRTVKKYIVHSG